MLTCYKINTLSVLLASKIVIYFLHRPEKSDKGHNNYLVFNELSYLKLDMIESIYLISGVLMGVIITIIGSKLGSNTYKNAVSDITQPPQFSGEDRTADTPPDYETSYNYDNYKDYMKTLDDDKVEEIN